MRALARLPLMAPRVEELRVGAGGAVEKSFPPEARTFAVGLSWQANLSRTGQPVRCELRLRDGRKIIASVAPMSGDKLSLVIGEAREPLVTRQFAAGWGDYRFTVVVRDGLLRFRSNSSWNSVCLRFGGRVRPLGHGH